MGDPTSGGRRVECSSLFVSVCVCVCVQVFRALRVSLTCNDLCDILSRLVETVAEQGEDMQVSH